MKVSTEIDNNFGYEKITQLVDNNPLNDAKKQYIFVETCLYEAVGSLPVMPSRLPVFCTCGEPWSFMFNLIYQADYYKIHSGFKYFMYLVPNAM
jgi:hypothetical protein